VDPRRGQPVPHGPGPPDPVESAEGVLRRAAGSLGVFQRGGPRDFLRFEFNMAETRRLLRELSGRPTREGLSPEGVTVYWMLKEGSRKSTGTSFRRTFVRPLDNLAIFLRAKSGRGGGWAGTSS